MQCVLIQGVCYLLSSFKNKVKNTKHQVIKQLDMKYYFKSMMRQHDNTLIPHCHVYGLLMHLNKTRNTERANSKY